MAKIKNIRAREILDSRGNPTVEAEVETLDGIFSGAVPSGASTGSREALELRDGEKRYGGKGVLKAVKNVNEIIAPALIGKDLIDQRNIDETLLSLDGTANKEKLGANAILAVSMATARAGATSKKIPLYTHIGDLSGNSKFKMPIPMVLVLEGGKHADQSSDLQEFMIMPHKAPTFREAIRMGSEIYQSIGKVLKKNGFNINVGFEGAYGPSLGSNEKVFEIIVEGISKAGYKPGEEINIATDSAASEFFVDAKYDMKADKKMLTSAELIDYYEALVKKYPIFSIEDGLSENDWENWTVLNQRLGDKIQIVGDDLTVTNVKHLQKAIDLKAINAILIKLNQIGTVTETIDAINLAKKNGCVSIVSHRSAETEDAFIADLVVGTGSEQCKFGATARSERTAKYNRLLKIEEELSK